MATDEVTPIHLPLALVTEIQRSGGSMAAQLFDGHPELFSHPFEIQIGHPRKWHWPELDLAGDAGLWFDRLFEAKLLHFVAKGYTKPGSNPYAQGEKHPFNFDPDRQRQVFLDRVRQRPPRSQRNILDAYFTAFFSAWSDFRSAGRERWITGFTPRLLMVPRSIAGLRRDYPDGRIITLVRDPRSWWASARRHAPREYGSLADAMRLWSASAEASLRIRLEDPERVYLTTYERIVIDTETVMREIAAFLGIAFDPILLTPTFLRRPIQANSSFPVSGYGINRGSLDRPDSLAGNERAVIEAMAMPAYARADRLARGLAPA